MNVKPNLDLLKAPYFNAFTSGELLKKINWRNRTIELRLADDGNLFGKVIDEKTHFIHPHQIIEIPKEVLARLLVLREYVKKSVTIQVPIFSDNEWIAENVVFSNHTDTHM